MTHDILAHHRDRQRTDNIKPGDSANLDVDLSRGRYRMYDPRGGYRELAGVRMTLRT
jgi:hypothetical protein